MVAEFSRKLQSQEKTKIFLQMAGIFSLLLIFLLVVADVKMYQRRQDLANEVAYYQQKIAAIKKSNATLQEEIDNVNSKEYLEKIAYEQGMVKTGEREVVFVKSPAKQQVEVKKPDVFAAWTSWFSNFWNWLKPEK